MQNTLKFMLYNIRYGTGTGVSYHFPVPFAGYFRPSLKNTQRIVSFIKKQSPDIVGLVEVDDGSYRSRRINQAQWIADELNCDHIYETKYGAASWARHMPVLSRQGNAFITNQKVQTRQFHFLRTGIKKLIIELEFDSFVIFLVHLSIKYRHRQQQLGDLYSLFSSCRKPMIVAGDFNAFWGDHELQLFMAATQLMNPNKDCAPTFPSIAPRRQLDFILHSPSIRVCNFKVLPVKYSDHMPLICEFVVPPSHTPESENAEHVRARPAW